jgi:hypothetical protein
MLGAFLELGIWDLELLLSPLCFACIALPICYKLKAMAKKSFALILLLLALLFAVGLLMGLFLTRWVGFHPAPKVYNTATLLQQVQTLSQLVTVKYVIEKVEILEDPPQNTIRALLPDNTHVVLLAHGIVKAGIDFGRLKPADLEISGKTVSVALPPAQITDAYLDDKQTQVIERNTGILRDFNKDLEQKARQNAVDDIRRAARDGGILKDADERARVQLTSLLKQFGFEKVEFRAR